MKSSLYAIYNESKKITFFLRIVFFCVCCSVGSLSYPIQVKRPTQHKTPFVIVLTLTFTFESPNLTYPNTCGPLNEWPEDTPTLPFHSLIALHSQPPPQSHKILLPYLDVPSSSSPSFLLPLPPLSTSKLWWMTSISVRMLMVERQPRK